jgi:hypothetical protein
MMDVSSAFINAPMKRKVYIEIPHDHPDQDKNQKYVFQLNRALYGTNDAPKLWNDELTKTLLELGFIKTISDWNMFYRKDSIIAFHVDDGILSASNQNVLNEVKNELQKRYKIKIQTENMEYLKLKLHKKNDHIYLEQTNYIIALAEKFKVTTARKIYTPMETGFDASVEDGDLKEIGNEVPYRALIGSLLYIARQTRSEITYAVNLLCQHVTKPRAKHWKAAKRILIYLYTTKDMCLRIGPVNEEGLKCFSDSTWADDKSTRSSRSGGVLLYNGSLITAYSHVQRSISLSSTQAEYQALTSAIQEIIYFRQLLGEIGYEQNLPTPLLCDNQGALYLSVSTKNHIKTKHIALRYHYIRDTIKDKLVNLLYVSTKDQLADIMTKPLGKELFEKFRKLLGIDHYEI